METLIKVVVTIALLVLAFLAVCSLIMMGACGYLVMAGLMLILLVYLGFSVWVVWCIKVRL